MTTTADTADTYRASGALNPGSTLMAALGGIVVALIAAGIVWAWERSPIPTLVILTPIIQGFILGFALAVLFARAKLRNPTLGLVFGLLCGAISVLAVHYGHYVSNVYEYRDMVRKEAAEITAQGGPQVALAQMVTSEVNANPFKAYSAFISELDESGHKGGFLGDMNVRAAMGVSIKRAEVTGKGMWVLWGVEALIVIGIAANMGRSRAAEPFCELCDRWMDTGDTPTVLPPNKSEEVAAVVGKGDALGLAALRSSTPYFDPTTGAVVVAAHVCPVCEDAYVDVVTRTPNKEGKLEEKKVVELAHASKDMLAALRADVQPATPQVAPGTPGVVTTTVTKSTST